MHKFYLFRNFLLLLILNIRFVHFARAFVRYGKCVHTGKVIFVTCFCHQNTVGAHNFICNIVFYEPIKASHPRCDASASENSERKWLVPRSLYLFIYWRELWVGTVKSHDIATPPTECCAKNIESFMLVEITQRAQAHLLSWKTYRETRVRKWMGREVVCVYVFRQTFD